MVQIYALDVTLHFGGITVSVGQSTEVWPSLFFLQLAPVYATEIITFVECAAYSRAYHLLVPVSSQSSNTSNTRVLKCYQCNSFYDRGCADYFDNMTYPLIPCPEKATMCRKIIQEGTWRHLSCCVVLAHTTTIRYFPVMRTNMAT